MTIFNSFLYVFQRVLGDLMHWHAMDMFRPTHEIMSSQHGVRYVGSTWFNQMELSFGHFGSASLGPQPDTPHDVLQFLLLELDVEDARQK